MSKLRAYRPSVGFLATLFIYVAVVVLIGWGMKTPALDRVWTLDQALKAGIQSNISAQERELFMRAFAAHPELADGLIDGRPIGLLSTDRGGWCSRGAAVLARIGGSEAELHVRIDSPSEDFPVRLDLAGSGWHRDVTFEENGVKQVMLPSVASDEVMTIEARGGPDGKAPTAFNVSFEEKP